MNPVAEMGRFIAGSINLARAKRQFAELLGWEACADVQADVVAHERAIAARAHKAETCDREALRVGDAATRPDSDGGANITPKEWAGIRARINRSAEIDHDVSEAATI